MEILLVESEPGLGAHVGRDLEAAGHNVVRCVTDEGPGPCVGLSATGLCPLDHHEIAVAVVARSGGELRPGEHGALCAARYRIPVVTTDAVTDDARSAADPGGPSELDVFAPVATRAEGDVVESVERAAASGTAHAAAVLRDLLRLGVLARDDVDGEEPAVAVSVERSPRRLSMSLWITEGHQREPAIVKAATEALRRHDPHVPVIDVRVSHPRR